MRDQLIAAFKTVFPNGYINVSNGVLGGESLYVTIGLIANRDDCSNRIRENDPMLSNFVVTGTVIESGLRGSSLSTKPQAGSYLAMGRVRFAFRKIKGKDEADMIAKWLKFLNAAKHDVIVERNANNIYNQENIKSEYLQLD